MAGDVTAPAARLADLMRQGFMKPRKVRTKKEPAVWVTCWDCLNWHRKGKHTADAAARKANRAARIVGEKAAAERRAAGAGAAVLILPAAP